MTATALTIHRKAGGAPPTLPTCLDYDLTHEREWNTLRVLAIARAQGALDDIPRLAMDMQSACQPIDRERLVQRLTALGMVMAPNRPPAEATMWIREMARLLSDLPEFAVLHAIDEHQRTKTFLPSTAEIRTIAEPEAEKMRRQASRLDAMARYINSGQPMPRLPAPPSPAARQTRDQPLTEAEVEETNARLARLGASTRYRPDGSRYEAESNETRRKELGPRRKPTRQDYIDLGVSPETLDGITQ
jgi:hypothetical protein